MNRRKNLIVSTLRCRKLPDQRLVAAAFAGGQEIRMVRSECREVGIATDGR